MLSTTLVMTKTKAIVTRTLGSFVASNSTKHRKALAAEPKIRVNSGVECATFRDAADCVHSGSSSWSLSNCCDADAWNDIKTKVENNFSALHSENPCFGKDKYCANADAI
jgi:hypothetical protein